MRALNDVKAIKHWTHWQNSKHEREAERRGTKENKIKLNNMILFNYYLDNDTS